VSLGGISVLELAQPPEGYRTTGGLVTTYSADLIACLAVLVALDGNGSDQLKYNKIEALRALERLRNRVRIVVQQNRVEWHNQGDARILGLFDSVLRSVPFDGRKKSFHPKVLLARQESKDNPDRYIFYVGSRNLTSSTAWDLGIGLVGYARGTQTPGTRRLANIPTFVAKICTLIGEPDFDRKLGRLGDISWELPQDVDRLEFFFHAGTPRGIHQTELSALPGRGKVLLVSPFLTPSMVEHAAKHFAKAESVRLVSVTRFLDKIAASKARKYFRGAGGSIGVYSMALGTDDAPVQARANGLEESEPERGLHAKVFCVTDGNRARAIVGSANLTHHAWLGANWEAFVTLHGSEELVAELWDWSGTRAHPYKIPSIPEIKQEKRDAIDDLRNELAEIEIRLVDVADCSSRLMSEQLPAILKRSGCVLNVARFTKPTLWVRWNYEESEVLLPPCDVGERTAFVCVRARKGDIEATWVQTVRVDPPLNEERDRQAFVRILGVEDFLSYLQSLINNVEFDGIERDNDDEAEKGNSPRAKNQNLFHLEELLRKLNRDPRSMDELDQTIVRYRDLFERAPMPSDERNRLLHFISLWAAISTGMRMA